MAAPMTIKDVGVTACWLAILASFVLSFSTWLALGHLAGFGVMAVAVPLCVDGYVVTALATWLSPEISQDLARFARSNLYAVGLASVAAQAGYHGVTTRGQGAWLVLLATVVGGLPPAIATLAVHIRARAAREHPVATHDTPGLSARTRTPESPIVTAPSAPVVTEPRQARATAPTRRQPVLPKPAAVSSGPTGLLETPEVAHAAEHDVAAMVSAGMTHGEIATRLGVSKRTATRRIADARADRSRLAVAS